MNIVIENNKVIVNLDEFEFPKFETMFANLHLNKRLRCEFREFGFDINLNLDLLPMHLCRTIGEANLSADPFATVSLYPFWKHGFAFGNGGPRSATGATREIKLTNEFKEKKGHGWLEKKNKT